MLPRRMPAATGICSFLVEIVYKPSFAAVTGRAKGEESIIYTLEVQRPYRKVGFHQRPFLSVGT